MTRNLGNLDRLARIVVAAAALIAGALLGFGSAIGIVLIAVAGVMLLTGGSARCPLYLPAHLSSCRRHPAGS
jgi:hypothetical protein